MKRIYLDNNATTALDPRVLEAMLDDLGPVPLNPSSIHFFGQEAKKKLLTARESISKYFRVKTDEIIFTSGGTEALNMILKGVFTTSTTSYAGHIITSEIEHSSVYNTIQDLESKGCEVTYLKTGTWGAVQAEQVSTAIKKNTKLIALGAVNGETGVKTDIAAIGKIAKDHHIPFAVDGVALLGKEQFTIPEGVSAMAFSGHKLHGPKGSGLAFIRSNLKLQPLLIGGPQEYSKRAGTENLAGILGLAKAIELLKDELHEAAKRMETLRNSLENGLKDRLGNVIVNGDGPRVVNTANLCFPGVDGETLLISLDLAGLAASHGSACTSGALEPSRVLLNMGVPGKIARSSIRFSLSRLTSAEDIEQAIQIISNIVQNLRK